MTLPAAPQAAILSPTSIPRSIFTMTDAQLERLQLMAKMCASAKKLSYGGDKAPTEGDYFVIMMKGIELGLEPLAAVDAIDLISGKPTLDPQGMLGLVNRCGYLEDFRVVEQSDQQCVIEVTRKGRSIHREVFSIDDANRMMTTEWDNGQKRTIPLSQKSNWKQQPRVMLKWRCVAAALRIVFPDIIMGLYTPEEIGTGAGLDVSVDDNGRMTVIQPANQPAPQPRASQSAALPPNATPFPGTQSTDEPHDDEPTPAPAWYTVENNKNYFLGAMVKGGVGKTKAEALTEVLRLTSHATWEDFGKAYETGKLATDAVQAALAAENANLPPASPKADAPATQSAPPKATPPQTSITVPEAMTALCFSRFDVSPAVMLKQMGRTDWSAFKDARTAETEVGKAAFAKQMPFTVTKVKYGAYNNGGKYLTFLYPGINTPINLSGGREALAKMLGGVSEQFEAANKTDTWEPGKEYTLKDPLKVTWVSKTSGDKTTLSVTGLTLMAAEPDIPDDDMPEGFDDVPPIEGAPAVDPETAALSDIPF